MTALRRLLDALPLSVLLIASLTLGLAPFVPEPHIWEKLKMLAAGELTQTIDILDSRDARRAVAASGVEAHRRAQARGLIAAPFT